MLKCRALLLLLSSALLAGCGPATKPMGGQAPWQDGEQCTYDAIKQGSWADELRVRVSKHAEGWSLQYERDAEPHRGEVVLAPDLSPRRAEHHRGDDRWQASYGEGEIAIVAEVNDKSQSLTVQRPSNLVDWEVGALVPRGLPLADGYERQLALFDVHNQVSYQTTLRVLGSETVEVPAGRFEAWHVAIDFGAFGQRELWYAKQAPHWFLKHRWAERASETWLRSCRAHAGASLRGPAERPASFPAPSTEPSPAVPPPSPRWSFVATSLCIQYPLMMLLPLVLVFWLRRRWGLPLWVAGAGALCFVASQVVHLPLNYALGLLGGGGPVTALPLIWIGVVVGLSAGLCEECARYVFMRWVLKKHQGWSSSIQFGAGHGGIESMIFGSLAALSLLNFLVLPLYGESTYTPELQATARMYWQHGWDTPIYAGMERVGAISAHIGLSVLVMRAVTRRNLGYLALAIGLHAALDAPIVFMSTLREHPLLLESGIVLVGLGFLALGWWLRDPAPATKPTAKAAPAAEPEK